MARKVILKVFWWFFLQMKEVHGELDIRADDEFVPEVILLLYDNDEADTLNSLSKTVFFFIFDFFFCLFFWL